MSSHGERRSSSPVEPAATPPGPRAAGLRAPVRVAASDDPARLAALRDEWRELHQAGAPTNPFLSWEWQYAHWHTLAQRRRLWLLEARDGADRLAGILALCARPSLGTPRGWSLLANGVPCADAVDVLVRPELAVAAREAMAQAISAALPRWSLLRLDDLPFGSGTVAAFRRALAPRGVRLSVTRRFACPGFALRGTFADHLARFPRRDTYLRRRRWLERQPGYGVVVTEAAAEAPEAMDDFLRLHHLRWDVEGGSAGIPRGPVEAFHREVAPMLARRGWLRLYRLFVGERSIAAVYGLELGGRFHYYQSGMDPAWAARSPGLVLLGRTVEDAYARGLSDYDFLRGTEPHKLDWASDRRETCTLSLRAPGLRSEVGAVAEEALRRARGTAKALAPELVWSALQRARRAVEVRGLSAWADAPRRGPGCAGDDRVEARRPTGAAAEGPRPDA